jgi:tape measure domain-containing protein
MSGIIIRTEARTQDAERNLNRLSESVKNVDKSSRSTADAVARMLKVIGTISAATLGLKFVQNLASDFQALENRIANVTGRTRELAATQRELLNISERTSSSLENSVRLYGSMGRALRQQGVSNRRLLEVTETLQKAITISGADAITAKAAIVQLGQGLSAGALRGEELNSVMENTPRIAGAIADNLGVSLGNLRLLAAQGKLTDKVVFTALLEQAKNINKEFEALQPTINQSTAVLVGNLRLVIFEFTKGLRIFERLAVIYMGLAKRLSNVTDEAFLLGNTISLVYYRTKAFFNTFNDALIKPVLSIIKAVTNAFLQMVPSLKVTFAIKNWFIRFARTFDETVLFGLVQFFKKLEFAALFKFETDLEKAVRRLRRLSPRYWIGAGFNKATLEKLFSADTIREFGSALTDIAKAIGDNQNSIAARFERLSISVGFATQAISRFFGFRPDTFITLKRGGFEPLFKSLSEIVRGTVRTSRYFWELSGIIRQILYPSIVILFKDIYRSTIPILNFISKSIQTTARIIWTAIRLIYQIFDDLTSVFAGKEVIYHFSTTTNKLISKAKNFATDMLDSLFPKTFEDRTKNVVEKIVKVIEGMSLRIRSFGDIANSFSQEDLIQYFSSLFYKLIDISEKLSKKLFENISVDKFKGKIKNTISGLAILFKDLFKEIGGYFSKDTSKVLVKNLKSELESLRVDLLKTSKAIVEILSKTLRNVLNKALNFSIDPSFDFSALYLELKESIKKLSKILLKLLFTTFERSQELFKEIGKIFWNAFSESIGKDLQKKLSNAANNLKRFTENVIEYFKTLYIRVIGNSYWTDTIGSIVSDSNNLWDHSSKGINEFKKNFIDTFKFIEKTRAGYEFKEIRITDQMSFQIPTARVGTLFYSAIEAAGKVVDTVLAAIYTIPEQIKLALLGLTGILALVLFPDTTFKNAFLLLILGAILRNSSKIGEAFSQALTGESVFNKVGRFLGQLAGRFVVEFVRNIPTLLNAVTSVISEFIKAFLAQIPILGKATTAIFATFAALGLGPTSGLLVTWLFGRSITSFLGSLGTSKKKVDGISKLFQGLHSRFVLGQGWGLLGTAVFGRFGANTGALLALVLDFFGSFNSLFVNSPLMHWVARGGLLYVLFTGRDGLNTILGGISKGVLKTFSALIPKIYKLLQLPIGSQMDLFGSIELSSFESLKLALFSIFTSISNKIVSIVAPFIQSKWNFLKTVFLGKDPARTITDIKNVFLDIYSVIRSTVANSSLVKGAGRLYQGLKTRASDFLMSQRMPATESFEDYKTRIAKELRHARMAYVRSAKGPENLRGPAFDAFQTAKARQAEISNAGFAFNFRKNANQSANLATKLGGETGLLGRLLLGKTGKFVIGGTIIAALALFSSNAFAASPNNADLDKMPTLFQGFSRELLKFSEDHPIFRFLAKLTLGILGLSTVIVASIRAVAYGKSASGVFGAIGGMIGGYIAYGITDSIEAALMVGFISASASAAIASTVATAIGNALVTALGTLVSGITWAAVGTFFGWIAAAVAAVLATAFVVGAGISLIKNYFFGTPGQLAREMKADWDAAKEFIFGPPKEPVIDTKGLKKTSLDFLAQQNIKINYDLSEVYTDRLTDGQQKTFANELKKFQDGVKEARNKDLVGDFGENELRTLESQAKRFERIVEIMRRKSAINLSEVAKELRGIVNTNVVTRADLIRTAPKQLDMTLDYYNQMIRTSGASFRNIPLFPVQDPEALEKQRKDLRRRRLTDFSVFGNRISDPGIENAARMLESIQNLRYEHPYLSKEVARTAARYLELASQMQRNIRIRDRYGSGSSERQKAVKALEEQVKLERELEGLTSRVRRFEEESAAIEKFQKELSSLASSLSRAKITLNLDELVISENNFRTLKMFGREAERIYEDLEKTNNVADRSALVLRLRTITTAVQDVIDDNLLDDYTKDNFQLKDKVSSTLGLELDDSFYANLDADVAADFLKELVEIDKLKRRMDQKPIPYMFGVGPTEDMPAAGYFEGIIRRSYSGVTDDLDAPIEEFPKTQFWQRIGKSFNRLEVIQFEVQGDETSFNLLEQRIEGVRNDILMLASKDFKGFMSALESLGVNGQNAFERLGLKATAAEFSKILMTTMDLRTLLTSISESGEPLTEEDLREIIRLQRIIAETKDNLNREPITLDVALGNVNTLGYSFDKKSIAGLSNENIQLIKSISEEVDNLNRELTNLKSSYDATKINAFNNALEENRKKLEAIYLQVLKNNKFSSLKNAGIANNFEQSLLSANEADQILESFARIKVLTDELNAGTEASRANYSKNLEEVVREERLQEIRISSSAKKTFGGVLGLVNEVFSTAFDNLSFSKFTSEAQKNLGSLAFFLKTALENAIRGGGEGIQEISEVTRLVFSKLNLIQEFEAVQKKIKEIADTTTKDGLARVQEISGFDFELEAYVNISKESQMEFESFLEKAQFLESLNMRRNLEPEIQARLNELSATGDIEYIYDTLVGEFEGLVNVFKDPMVSSLDAVVLSNTNLAAVVQKLYELLNASNGLTSRATGGPISGPGTGTSDSILARLSNGEFVINAASTRKHRNLIEQINSDKLPKFAKGGIIPGFYTGGIASIVNQDPLYQRIMQLNSDPDFLKLSLSERNRVIAELTNSNIKNMPEKIVPRFSATTKPGTAFIERSNFLLAPEGNSYVRTGHYARNPDSVLTNQSFHRAVGERISKNIGIRPNQQADLQYVAAKIAQQTSGDQNLLFTRHPTSRHANDLRAPLSRRVIEDMDPTTNTTYNKVIQRFSEEYDDTRQFRRTLDRKWSFQGWGKLGGQFKDMGSAALGQLRHAPVSTLGSLGVRVVVGAYIDDWLRNQFNIEKNFHTIADKLEPFAPLPARAAIATTGTVLEEAFIGSLGALTGRGAFVGTKMLGRIPAVDRIKLFKEVRERYKGFAQGGFVDEEPTFISNVLFDGANAKIMEKTAVGIKDLGFASGGLIKGPGTGTSDSIIARVSNGESIITADATKKYWPMLKAMNEGQKLPGFNQGAVSVGNTQSTNFGQIIIETLTKSLELAISNEDLFSQTSQLGSISGASLSIADATKIKFEDLVNIRSMQQGTAELKLELQKAMIARDPDRILKARLAFEKALRDTTEAIEIALEDFAERVAERSKEFASSMTSTVQSSIGKVLKEGETEDFFTDIATSFSHGIIDSFVEGLTQPFKKQSEAYMKQISAGVMNLVPGAVSEYSDDAKKAVSFPSAASYDFTPSEGMWPEKPLKPLTDASEEASQPIVNSVNMLGIGLSAIGLQQNDTLLTIAGLMPLILTLMQQEKVQEAMASGWGALKGIFGVAATGGLIKGPGTGTSDSIPMMLSNGEFVVNAKAARKFRPLITAINNNSIKGLAEGGLVGSSLLDMPATSIDLAKETNNSSQTTLHLGITGDISRQTRREVMGMIPMLATGINAYNKEMNYKGR